jgi:four helix bundle protein
MFGKIQNYTDLLLFKDAIKIARDLYRLSEGFPEEETASIVEQMRRSNHSVCLKIAEAWVMRGRPAAFFECLSDAKKETGESQAWIEVAGKCGYIKEDKCRILDSAYEKISSQIFIMIEESGKCSSADNFF